MAFAPPTDPLSLDQRNLSLERKPAPPPFQPSVQNAALAGQAAGQQASAYAAGILKGKGQIQSPANPADQPGTAPSTPPLRSAMSNYQDPGLGSMAPKATDSPVWDQKPATPPPLVNASGAKIAGIVAPDQQSGSVTINRLTGKPFGWRPGDPDPTTSQMAAAATPKAPPLTEQQRNGKTTGMSVTTQGTTAPTSAADFSAQTTNAGIAGENAAMASASPVKPGGLTAPTSAQLPPTTPAPPSAPPSASAGELAKANLDMRTPPKGSQIGKLPQESSLTPNGGKGTSALSQLKSPSEDQKPKATGKSSQVGAFMSEPTITDSNEALRIKGRKENADRIAKDPASETRLQADTANIRAAEAEKKSKDAKWVSEDKSQRAQNKKTFEENDAYLKSDASTPSLLEPTSWAAKGLRAVRRSLNDAAYQQR